LLTLPRRIVVEEMIECCHDEEKRYRAR